MARARNTTTAARDPFAAALGTRRGRKLTPEAADASVAHAIRRLTAPKWPVGELLELLGDLKAPGLHGPYERLRDELARAAAARTTARWKQQNVTLLSLVGVQHGLGASAAITRRQQPALAARIDALAGTSAADPDRALLDSAEDTYRDALIEECSQRLANDPAHALLLVTDAAAYHDRVRDLQELTGRPLARLAADLDIQACRRIVTAAVTPAWSRTTLRGTSSVSQLPRRRAEVLGVFMGELAATAGATMTGPHAPLPAAKLRRVSAGNYVSADGRFELQGPAMDASLAAVARVWLLTDTAELTPASGAMPVTYGPFDTRRQAAQYITELTATK